MRNLLVDIGNSSVKAAYAKGLLIDKITVYKGDDIVTFINSLVINEKPYSIVISSVRKNREYIKESLQHLDINILVVGENVPINIGINYRPVKSLGSDRLAAVIGAHELFPKKKCIIFDFGTALTIDFKDEEGNFAGGNISLGLSTRFKALEMFTQKLPLLSAPENIGEIGVTTASAIENGIILGMIKEIEGYINKYPDYIIIFTGGDSNYFAIKLKSPIFVVYNLVLTGLARIAENNVHV